MTDAVTDRVEGECVTTVKSQNSPSIDVDFMEKGASEVENNFEFDFHDPGNWGIVIHCWCLGFVSGGFNAFLMGVVAGYLHVPSDIIRGLQNMSSLPNVLSVFMGVVSDSRPIFGYRRRPYMMGGIFTIDCHSDYFYVPLAICLFSANIGLLVSGAAGRGLIVEYAKAEEEERWSVWSGRCRR
eukprot:s5692_g4.t1